MKAKIIQDDYGMIFCENCKSEITCDEYGDMPEKCRNCGSELDYSDFTED